MQHFFRSVKPLRLCDALGIDELLALRGLEDVTVSHIPVRKVYRRSDKNFRRPDEDRASLQALLWETLVRPTDDADDEDDMDVE